MRCVRTTGTSFRVVMPSVGPCRLPLANRRLADLLEFGEEVCGVWGNQHPSNHPAGAYCLNRSVDEEKDHILRLPLMVLRADEDILTSVMNDDDRRLTYALPLLAIACWHRPGGKQQPATWAGWMESRGVTTRAQQRGVPAEPPALWSVAGGIWTRFKKVAAMKRPPLREVVAIVDELRGALLALRTRSELEVLAAQVAGHDAQLAGHDAQLKQMQQRLVALEAAGGAIMPRRAGRFSEPSVLVVKAPPPAADEPAADEPAADEPAVDEPDADEPDADEPDADEPDDDEPDDGKLDDDELDEAAQQTQQSRAALRVLDSNVASATPGACGVCEEGEAMDAAPPSSPDVEEVPPPARPTPVVVDLASVPTPPRPTEVQTTALAAAAEEEQLVKKEAVVEAASAWLLADRLAEIKNQLQLVRMRRIFIPVRNAQGEGPAYRALDAAGFSFNFCTYTCEMTLRDEDGEEVRDENGYVTLMDDGFSWGAHWEYPRAGDDVWGEKKNCRAYRTWERDAWQATRAGEHIMRMWRACLARRPIAPGSEVEWL